MSNDAECPMCGQPARIVSGHEGTTYYAPAPVVWVNVESTVLVRRYSSGRMEVATREEPDAIWGPPTSVLPE